MKKITLALLIGCLYIWWLVIPKGLYKHLLCAPEGSLGVGAASTLVHWASRMICRRSGIDWSVDVHIVEFIKREKENKDKNKKAFSGKTEKTKTENDIFIRETSFHKNVFADN